MPFDSAKVLAAEKRQLKDDNKILNAEVKNLNGQVVECRGFVRELKAGQKKDEDLIKSYEGKVIRLENKNGTLSNELTTLQIRFKIRGKVIIWLPVGTAIAAAAATYFIIK